MGTLTHTFAQVQDAIDQQYDGEQAGTVGYDDLQGAVVSSRKLAGKEPAERLFNYGITSGVEFVTDGFAVGEAVQITIQTKHANKILSALDEHLHFTTPTDATGDRMKWQMDVIYADVGDAYSVPTGSPFTAEHTFVDGTAGTHGIFDVADVPAVNDGVSGIFKILVTRIAASQDEYSGEIYVDYIDGHIQNDQERGSRTEYTK